MADRHSNGLRGEEHGNLNQQSTDYFTINGQNSYPDQMQQQQFQGDDNESEIINLIMSLQTDQLFTGK